MFRTLTPVMLTLLAIGSPVAKESSGEPPCSAGPPSERARFALQATQRHLAAALDWRSYYLNRPDPDGAARPRGAKSPQPPAVDCDACSPMPATSWAAVDACRCVERRLDRC